MYVLNTEYIFNWYVSNFDTTWIKFMRTPEHLYAILKEKLFSSSQYQKEREIESQERVNNKNGAFHMFLDSSCVCSRSTCLELVLLMFCHWI